MLVITNIAGNYGSAITTTESSCYANTALPDPPIPPTVSQAVSQRAFRLARPLDCRLESSAQTEADLVTITIAVSEKTPFPIAAATILSESAGAGLIARIGLRPLACGKACQAISLSLCQPDSEVESRVDSLMPADSKSPALSQGRTQA